MLLLSLSIAMFGGLDIDLAALKTAENLRALCRRPGVQKIFLEDVMSIKSAIGEYIMAIHFSNQKRPSRSRYTGRCREICCRQ